MLEQGFVRLAAAVPCIKVAGCAGNAESIAGCITRASEGGAAVVALPELCITGSTAGDLLFQDALVMGALEALTQVMDATYKLDIVAAVGLPLRLGTRLFNCTALIQRGKLLAVVSGARATRHFSPGPEQPEELTICGTTVPFGTRLLLSRPAVNPGLVLAVETGCGLAAPLPRLAGHALAGATVLLNPAAPPETAGSAAQRRLLAKGCSLTSHSALVYAGAGEGESTTDQLFAGHCMLAECGDILAESRPFEAGVTFADVDLERICAERLRAGGFGQSRAYLYAPLGKLPAAEALPRLSKTPFIPTGGAEKAEYCSTILAMQAEGLAARMRHVGSKKLVIGVSGGLDSTLALLACCGAAKRCGLNNSAISAYTLPCFGTTQRTRSNAELLCSALGVQLTCIDIGRSVLGHLKDIGLSEQDRSTAFENAQARERTQVLMDVANMQNGLVVGTGDLSELALGFATYGGDHLSMYGVNASIPKTLMREVVAHAALQNPAIAPVLQDILATPISPELLPEAEGAQHTEEIVGPYELHDFFLYHTLRYGRPPSSTFKLACRAFAELPPETIKKWLLVFYRRFFAQQFKRSCLPDGAAVGPVSLSPRGAWRMPSDAVGKLWLDEAEKL